MENENPIHWMGPRPACLGDLLFPITSRACLSLLLEEFPGSPVGLALDLTVGTA